MINIGVSRIVINEGNKIFGTPKKLFLHGFANVGVHQIKNHMNGVSLEKSEKESLQCLSIIQPSQSGRSLKGFNNLQRSLV